MTYATMDHSAEFRVGTVLSRAWRIFAPNSPVFVAITFIVALPNFVYLTRDPTLPGYLPAVFGAMFAGIVMNAIGKAVILFASFQQLRGEPVRVASALQRALARFLPLIGLGFLYGLGIFFGMLLLIVPGIILITMWLVAVPVCVVEGEGPFASLSRSAELTKGHRWQIFGIIVLLGIANGVGAFLLGFALARAGLVVTALASVIWAAVWTAYWNCALIMIYHDLRVAKEGIDTRQIASVFD
jgi:hypothetical protein